MRFLTTAIIVLFSVINTHYAKAQQTLEGKYLVSVSKDGEASFQDMLMEINNGAMTIISAEKKANFPFAKIQAQQGTAKIEFNPMLEQSESDFTIARLPKGLIRLQAEQTAITLKPYQANEKANKAIGILGKWQWQEGNNTLQLHFELPDIVHITVGKQYENSSTSSFWFAKGQDVTITAPLFFNKFVGTLKHIQIKEGKLHFEHNGKHYMMSNEQLVISN